MKEKFWSFRRNEISALKNKDINEIYEIYKPRHFSRQSSHFFEKPEKTSRYNDQGECVGEIPKHFPSSKYFCQK